MGGVSPETCWAIKIHWNNKFYYTVASCWFFLWDLYYDARIHEDEVVAIQVCTGIIRNLHFVYNVLCVSCDSLNTQLFPYTMLNDWSF